MIIVNKDEIAAIKTERRKKIKELEYHAYGDCIHVGKISRGCKGCFIRSDKNQFAIYTGCECNCSCKYCYYDPNRNDNNWSIEQKIRNNLADLYALTIDPFCELESVSYNSWGETLKYMEVIEEAGRMIKRAELATGRKIYSHLYTNGTLATKEILDVLKDAHVYEIRFHISASNFSKDVLENMKIAKEMGFIVTVEEPALPENKEKIMELFPYFEKIKLDHLDIVECQVTLFNKKYLEKKYPNGKIYRDYLWQFYDDGMIYDLIEEKIKNKYSFSIIDCNSRVESCRSGQQLYIQELINANFMEGATNNNF